VSRDVLLLAPEFFFSNHTYNLGFTARRYLQDLG
jgi:hypothetical protein